MMNKSTLPEQETVLRLCGRNKQVCATVSIRHHNSLIKYIMVLPEAKKQKSTLLQHCMQSQLVIRTVAQLMSANQYIAILYCNLPYK